MSRHQSLCRTHATRMTPEPIPAAEQLGYQLCLRAGLLLAVLAALLVAPMVSWAEDQKVAVVVNGCPQYFSPAAFSREGVTYVPLRQGVEAVGGRLAWDAVNSRAIITAGTQVAVVKKTQGLIVNGSLFIPLRMVGEALDCRVSWDGATKTVRIETREAPVVPT